ncbi:MAG: hypothetical protein SF053_16675 [Bacteroidia bacterium]|nr:hypothetical protein [Bacteroidia bacterium]
MKLLKSVLICLFVSLLAMTGCSTEIDLNAPARDIWVVYGVLSQPDTVQYVRIAKAFLPESDALVFAKENDLSAKGLKVTLTGGGRTYEAVQIDSVMKNPPDGVFNPYTTLYKFRTAGNLALQEGITYQLRVTQPGTDTFALEASTTIPKKVRFNNPIEVPGPGQKRCLRMVNLELDYAVEFTREGTGAYEMRVFLDYTADGVARQAVYGPTALFTDDIRCNTGGSTACYNFKAYEVIRGFYNQIQPQPTVNYLYGVDENNRCKEVVENLPVVFRFEVTSMDTYLTNYRQANNPAFADFNTVRPEYTNITASAGSYAIGLLGSTNRNFARARLSPCAEYLLDLNNTPKPEGICAL